MAAPRCWWSRIAGINAAKWLAAHPVASRTPNTPANMAWVAPDPRRPSRPCGSTADDSGTVFGPVAAFDQFTDLLPRVSVHGHQPMPTGRKTIPAMELFPPAPKCPPSSTNSPAALGTPSLSVARRGFNHDQSKPGGRPEPSLGCAGDVDQSGAGTRVTS